MLIYSENLAGYDSCLYFTDEGNEAQRVKVRVALSPLLREKQLREWDRGNIGTNQNANYTHTHNTLKVLIL